MTSMLTMSPSCSGRESGMPWHMTSLIDVHTLFGNPPAKRLGEVENLVLFCTNRACRHLLTFSYVPRPCVDERIVQHTLTARQARARWHLAPRRCMCITLWWTWAAVDTHRI